MKVNFNKAFTNYKGEAILKDGKEQLIRDVIAPVLFDGNWISSTSPEEKMMSYDLSCRIYAADGEVEITTEEASLIKRGAQILNAAGYAQIHKLIEG
ncbi:hypothetical protein EZS27_027880 [termite gut metagenome]|jgi:hypothetical protein|uniref:Uncharacterized protein n=1 Tax=termite gut metagenome TaxID=433724 RepID=A0A5J4QNT7_9ZZZZ